MVLHGVPAYDILSEFSTQRKITLIILDCVLWQNPHEASCDGF